jgi:DNA-binding MarR family transcriptional regulator
VTPGKEQFLGTVYLLKRAELAVRSCVETALAPFRLTPTQFLLMLRLEEAGALSSAELARGAGVRPQSIVELIGSLERKGWIKRREAPEHRRILRITLSTTGRQVLAKVKTVASQLEKELLTEVRARNLKPLRAALTKLLANAESHDMHPGVMRSTARAARRAKVARVSRKPASDTRARRRTSP